MTSGRINPAHTRQGLTGGSLKAGSEAGREYRCPYNTGLLVREIRIEWPCPACGADFGGEPVGCFDRKPDPQSTGRAS